VTLADARRVAQRLLGNGLLVSVVGEPEGVASANAAAGQPGPTRPVVPAVPVSANSELR
jgi:hypothetical protein